MESTFASRVKQFRQHKGLSQQAFAEQCDLAQGNIAHMENGTEPKQSNVSKLTAGFPDLNPDWLLNGSGPMLRDGRTLTAVPADQLPPAVPSEAKPGGVPTPGYDIMAVNRITPEEAVAIQLENARLKQELETQTQLIAELRADKGHLWKQNTILLEKKPEASVEAAPLTDTVDELAHQLFNPAAHKEVVGFQTQGQRLRLA